MFIDIFSLQSGSGIFNNELKLCQIQDWDKHGRQKHTFICGRVAYYSLFLKIIYLRKVPYMIKNMWRFSMTFTMKQQQTKQKTKNFQDGTVYQFGVVCSIRVSIRVYWRFQGLSMLLSIELLPHLLNHSQRY